MAETRVFLNGREIARHRDGFTPFEAPLTPHLTPGPNELRVTLSGFGAARLWSPESPALYSVAVRLDGPEGTDCLTESFGFRTAAFTDHGFFLNGERVKIVGLNRHQSFPHVGYALGPAAQAQDAHMLKYELGLNLVCMSHYPQSKAFLQECDRIGLMVFEEIPGWQHIGDAQWQTASVENLRAMVTRDWNHPSIILWGVRINESPDNDDFYSRTNALCRALDPTRQTGGVRCITDSTMLEDVFTMNDFILGAEAVPGANHPRMAIRDQRAVTGLDRDVPYLITEYGGHMYPTQADDGEERQMQHVANHLDILNATYGDDRISGCIGWCFADYNTHKDFGSGDGICHHGMLDMFRAPKMAAAVYASQIDPARKPVMEPVTYWSVGGRSLGGCFPLTILTNLDTITIRQGDLVAEGLTPARALDQAGNRLPFLKSGITVSVDGAATLVGPAHIVFRGGQAGFWIRTRHAVGPVRVTVACPRFEPHHLTLDVAAPCPT